jgi:hypothetical protein
MSWAPASILAIFAVMGILILAAIVEMHWQKRQ